MNNFDYIKPTDSTAVIVPTTADKENINQIESISPLLRLGYFDNGKIRKKKKNHTTFVLFIL
jgi:hypothetical protein